MLGYGKTEKERGISGLFFFLNHLNACVQHRENTCLWSSGLSTVNSVRNFSSIVNQACNLYWKSPEPEFLQILNYHCEW